MTASWSLGKRIAFRFAFIVAALQVIPFPLGLVPGTRWIVDLVMRAWDVGVAWVARAILGIPEPAHVFTGSGDTMWHYVQLLLVAMLATVGTIVWSIAGRRQQSHVRLASAAIVVLRYYLGFMLLLYGLAKVLEIQFVSPSPARLDERIGDMSPMGMLWTFMGSSRPYTVFGGLLEVIPGVLLLWRRTTMIGALIAIAVLGNIVMLNFSYDVPVKLFSLQLLAYAIAIALPHAFRLLAAALGYPVPEIAPRVRSTPSWERVRRLARLALLATIGCWLIASALASHDWQPPRTPLHGIWVVESFVVDGEERPPLLTDSTRWRKLLVSRGYVTVRSMSDVRTMYRANVDADTIHVHRNIGAPEAWRYTRTDDLLIIEGTHQERALRVRLRLEPEPLLTSRGFHWVNEVPFYR